MSGAVSETRVARAEHEGEDPWAPGGTERPLRIAAGEVDPQFDAAHERALRTAHGQWNGPRASEGESGVASEEPLSFDQAMAARIKLVPYAWKSPKEIPPPANGSTGRTIFADTSPAPSQAAAPAKPRN